MPADRVRARLRVFRATEDPAGCRAYLAAHRAVLDYHRMYGLTSLDPEWFDNPLVHAVVLESLDDGTLLAGMRVQLADGGRFALPTELAYRQGAQVRDYVRHRLAVGVGEVCGAWLAPVFAKTEVFPLMCRAGFALTAPLGVRVALASCATYTVHHLAGVGLVRERGLGDDGTFYYPTPDNLSFFMVLPDTATLAHAPAANRRDILYLRARPVQRRVVHAGRFLLEVDIDLRLASHVRHDSRRLRHAG